jgi:pyruvate dehydrogenase E1 component beta subunit
MEEHFLPDLDRILDGVDRVMGRRNSLSGMTHAAAAERSA